MIYLALLLIDPRQNVVIGMGVGVSPMTTRAVSDLAELDNFFQGIYATACPSKYALNLKEFVEKYGEPFSKTLCIDLPSGRNDEIVKWFLASILYSKPIRENSATLTYKTFEEYETLTVDSILKTGWDGLVQILDEGGYARYDFSTATKLLTVFGALKRDYGSDLRNLYNAAQDDCDLERRLKALGKGIGDTTVSVFLRDMREIWPKARPKPTPLVKSAMEKLGIRNLNRFARQKRLNLMRLETALLRLGKDFLRKGREISIEP